MATNRNNFGISGNYRMMGSPTLEATTLFIANSLVVLGEFGRCKTMKF
jgi:hypothetical protein